MHTSYELCDALIGTGVILAHAKIYIGIYIEVHVFIFVFYLHIYRQKF